MISVNYFLIWIGILSLLAVIFTVSDKVKAKKGAWRIPEATLITVSLLGGSVMMYCTMRFIRHKTRHAKFMVGIPVIIVLQIAAVAAAMYYGYLVL
ncbi:MAG: DUF1294 domain-containing protein [Clostridia bacterium]|nr:DUF1294 domain-containing protein [Clostridia bacterium]